jgi:hypothetical protein
VWNLELDQALCDKARASDDVLLNNVFHGDVRDFNFHPEGIPHADIIFWSHGPEHIHRHEWSKTLTRLERMATRGVILQVPGGSGYDYADEHLSKNIQRGEFEKFGYTEAYEGEWDTLNCSILAHKIKTKPKANKIFVYGFPHTGTSILRKLIGNSPDVYEFVGETGYCPAFLNPEKEVKEDNIVFKLPIGRFPYDFYKTSHKDYKIVMIIKNPYDVFGSLYKRLGDLEHESHTIADWVYYAEKFKSFLESPKSNVFAVKYEELFDNNFRKIEEIFDFLGLDYLYDSIIRRERPTYIVRGVDIPKNRPPRYRHDAYRTWQINQKFRDMTGMGAKHLPKHFKDELSALPVVKDLGY